MGEPRRRAASQTEHRVMLAEAHRELGEHERALAALAGEFPEELTLAVGRIRALAEARQARVAVLFGGGEEPGQPGDPRRD